MAMFDLVVSGGTHVLPGGAESVDLAVAGGKIVAIGARGSLAALGAARVIDAAGQIVIPGGVDPHIHCSMAITMPNQPEPTVSAPASQVSKAALFGGTTTLIDFVPVAEEATIREAIELRLSDWTGACYCDYGLHLMLFDHISPNKLGEIPEAMQAGYASVKMFTTDITPARMARLVPFGDIWEVIQAVAKAGGLTCIHAEDNELVMHMYEKLTREDRTGFENLAAAHTTLSEDLAFNRVIRLAESVEGAAMYMVHTSAATGVAAMAAARARGFPVYGETLHQYLLYNSADYNREGGQIYHTYPSLKFPEDQAALWRAMRHGAIQCVATDEVCCPLEVKLKGRRIDDVMGGNSGVEPRVSLMYTQMVRERGFSLEEFVALVSSNAAKIMGLYPRKGALAVGSDADIVLLDPGRAGAIRKENMHETDYTPWEGWDAAVWPSVTIQRGKVAVENGKLRADLADGQFLPRKIDDEIRSRPAL
jgi:dihydropyrimidinase